MSVIGGVDWGKLPNVDWGDESAPQVIVPEGEPFSPSGMIGPLSMQYLWMFMAQVDLKDEAYAEHNLDIFFAEKASPTSEYIKYYFKDQMAAKNAAMAAEVKGGGTQTFIVQVKLDEVINFATPDARAKFNSDRMTGECQVVGARSKNRHVYNLIALPTLIASVARMFGMKDATFDISELFVREEDFVITDDLQAQWVGGGDAKFNMKSLMEETEFGKRRAALWAMLGEPDPTKYTPIGTKDATGKLLDTNTTSEALSACAKLATRSWKAPHWGRFVQVLDPRVDALTNSGKRLRIPVIMDLWQTAADAKKVAEEEKARFAKNDDGASAAATATTAANTPKPDLPKDWEGMETDWLAAIKPLKGATPPKIKKAIETENLSATVDEVKAWLPWA